jgi:hypothetical protein
LNFELQILQDSTRRSLLRATMEGSKFTRAELEQFYIWFEVSRDVYQEFMSHIALFHE